MLAAEPKTANKNGRCLPFFFTIVCITALLLVFVLEIIETKESAFVRPIRVKIPWMEDKPLVMEVGTARVMSPLFFSGNDDRSSPKFSAVTMKEVMWRTYPEGIAEVDEYGRLYALAPGECYLTL